MVPVLAVDADGILPLVRGSAVSKGTPHHAVRIEDDLWKEAKAVAALNGETLSDVIRDALRRYVEQDSR